MSEENTVKVTARLPRKLHLGAQIVDLHYGWKQQHFTEWYRIVEMVEWRWSWHDETLRDLRKKFLELCTEAAKHAGQSYTNKMLVVIAEPNVDDIWTCAWVYDSIGFGVVQIIERA